MNETRDYLCTDQGYYNDMATLMFNPHETVIKLLFHHNGMLGTFCCHLQCAWALIINHGSLVALDF